MRLAKPEAKKAVEAWLEEEFPVQAPSFTMVMDGVENWAFWVLEEDTTSYVHADGKIEWLGTNWESDGPDEETLDLMRHALGWPKCYRNYYVAAEEGGPWDRLVTLGLARKGKATQWSSGIVYHVTERGTQVLKEHEDRFQELADWAEETRRVYGGMERVRNRFGFDTPVYRAIRRILDERDDEQAQQK